MAKPSKRTQGRRVTQRKVREEEDSSVSQQVQELWYSVMAEQRSGALWGQPEVAMNAAVGGKRLKQAQK